MKKCELLLGIYERCPIFLSLKLLLIKIKFMFRFLLLPFSLIYRFITGVRNFLFDNGVLKSKEFDISIISIGNLTVGGTGKTPHTEYLVKILKKNFNIATLSRGYKRKTKGYVLSKPNSSFKEIGDEPKQISTKFPDIKVVVCENRVKGIKKILNHDPKTEIVILDDAFQHRHLKPSISILLTDYNHPFYDDFMLPYGNLREDWSQYHRANIIIVTKAPDNLKPIDRRILAKKINVLPYQTIFFTSIKYSELKPIFKTKKINLNNEIFLHEKYNVLAISGIARTELFIDYINKNITDSINHLNYPDHYTYKEKDIKHIFLEFDKIQNQKKLIITTEKDAVKFRESKLINEDYYKYLYYIPIEINFLFDSEEEFKLQIINNITKNRTNYQLQTNLKQF